jgi:hypothetical protein
MGEPVALIGGYYEAKSIIAAAQACVNLYPEANPKSAQSPFPYTNYLTPGLTLLVSTIYATVRCVYRTSNGLLYAVVGSNVYYVGQDYSLTLVGIIGSGSNSVYMADNGLAAVIVDGTPNGYAIDLLTNNFGQISSVNFYGADRIGYLDTYFLFNRPGTAQMYISLSEVDYSMLVGGTAFDALDIAAKTGYPDAIAGIVVMHREAWLIGTLTAEIWYNSGAPDFTFEAMPGAFIEHGCAAPYSIAQQDLNVYWLSQDEEGQTIVLLGNSYRVERISTNALENEISKYTNISDAIGYCYQEEGHAFYVLTFPNANATWVFDQSVKLWHQRAWTDPNGGLNRHRSNCATNAYGVNIVGDWENGNLYALDVTNFTDNGQPISRIRSFPHLVKGSRRIVHKSFIADMDVGEDDGSIDGSTPFNPPVVSLRWSDDKGKSFGNRLEQSLGAGGQYQTNIKYNRLGMARDRIYELSWSCPCGTALNGAYLETELCET